jgi:hypothetical protein
MFGPPRFYPVGCLPVSAMPTWFFSSGAGNVVLAGLLLPLWMHLAVQGVALAVVAAKLPRLCACLPPGALDGAYGAIAGAHRAAGGSLLAKWLPAAAGALPGGGCAPVLGAVVAGKTLLATMAVSLATEATARACFLKSQPEAEPTDAAPAAVAAAGGDNVAGGSSAPPEHPRLSAAATATTTSHPALLALELQRLAARSCASVVVVATLLPLLWEVAVVAARWAGSGAPPRLLEAAAVATSLVLQGFMRYWLHLVLALLVVPPAAAWLAPRDGQHAQALRLG